MQKIAFMVNMAPCQLGQKTYVIHIHVLLQVGYVVVDLNIMPVIIIKPFILSLGGDVIGKRITANRRAAGAGAGIRRFGKGGTMLRLVIRQARPASPVVG